MQHTRSRCFAVITLLFASAACYADLPRLNVVMSLGDTLNAARLLDVVSHIRLVRQAQDATLDSEVAAEAAEDLSDGRRSLDLINHNPRLPMALPTQLRYVAPTLAAQDPGIPSGADVALLVQTPIGACVEARPPPDASRRSAACPGTDVIPGAHVQRGPPQQA